jgi:prepilin-type processing-associated H-X9-DG protein
MELYVASYNNVYPGCASVNEFGFAPTDWIYWQTNQWNAFPLKNSPIAQFIGGINVPTAGEVNLLRCPMDTYDAERNTRNPYIFSYSLTSYNLNSEGISGNPGLASINDRLHTGLWMPFKSTDVNSPSTKIMFAEEQTSKLASQLNSGQCSVVGGNIINDGRFNAPSDIITSRHSKKGDVTFVDGHVEAVFWTFGTNVAYTLPSY